VLILMFALLVVGACSWRIFLSAPREGGAVIAT
jgi:hypothetical protein